MRAEKVIYMQTFPTGNFSNQKLGVEILLEPGEGVEECFKSAKSAVEAAFKAMNPSPTPSITDYNTGEQVTQEIREDRVIGFFGDDILSCKDLKTLETYKLLVKGKPELQEIYDKVFSELNKNK